METVAASYSWTGPESDVMQLLVEPSQWQWLAEPVDGNPLIAVFHEIDEDWQETGRIAGVEIVGFSTFNQWDLLPDLPLRWQLPGQEPLALRQVLEMIQSHVRKEATTPTRAA